MPVLESAVAALSPDPINHSSTSFDLSKVSSTLRACLPNTPLCAKTKFVLAIIGLALLPSSEGLPTGDGDFLWLECSVLWPSSSPFGE